MLVQKEVSAPAARRINAMTAEELEKLLGVAKEEIQEDGEPSKWAKIAERLRNDKDIKDPEFKKVWKGVKASMREVHENLEFIHDR